MHDRAPICRTPLKFEEGCTNTLPYYMYHNVDARGWNWQAGLQMYFQEIVTTIAGQCRLTTVDSRY
jgi:hypothetical protein